MTAATSPMGDPSAPPEVEAELVGSSADPAPRIEAPAAAEPKRRSLWPLGLAAVAAAAVGGVAYFAISGVLKPKPAAEAPAAPVVEAQAEVAASPPGPEERQGPAAALPAVDEGDAVAAATPADAAAPETREPAGDPLTELQALAERQAAEEILGVPAIDAPAGAEAADSSIGETRAMPAPAGAALDVAAELSALRALFETETGRLSAALDAERARAAAQAEEIAALRADLAARAAPSAQPAAPDASRMAEASRARGGDRATLVLFALARAIESGSPYRAELARAEALAPDSPAIARLRVDAADGAPTLAALKSRFPAGMRRALAADAGKNGGLVGRFSSGLADLISVRPAGPVKGASPRAVLSRAEAAFAADDLDGALSELRALTGPAREALAPFIADAERLAEARAGLAELNAQLIEAAAG